MSPRSKGVGNLGLGKICQNINKKTAKWLKIL